MTCRISETRVFNEKKMEESDLNNEFKKEKRNVIVVTKKNQK